MLTGDYTELVIEVGGEFSCCALLAEFFYGWYATDSDYCLDPWAGLHTLYVQQMDFAKLVLYSVAASHWLIIEMHTAIPGAKFE